MKPPTEEMIAEGHRLHAARKNAKLTQFDLAAKTGLGRMTIIRYERGEVTRRDEHARICAALGIATAAPRPAPPAGPPQRFFADRLPSGAIRVVSVRYWGDDDMDRLESGRDLRIEAPFRESAPNEETALAWLLSQEESACRDRDVWVGRLRALVKGAP